MLHVALVLLFQARLGFDLHVPGRAVPHLLSLLATQLDPRDAGILEDGHRVLTDMVAAARRKEQPAQRKAEGRFEQLKPSLLALVVDRLDDGP